MLIPNLLSLFSPSAAFVHSEDSRALAADVREALARADISIKEASIWMDVDESQLVRSLSCREDAHLSAYRLAKLPMKFWTAFVQARAKRNGQLVLDDSGLQKLIDGVQQLVAKKRMAKAGLKPQTKERVS